MSSIEDLTKEVPHRKT